jgi:dinuclear metal center YbgI/SA1388 family protein
MNTCANIIKGLENLFPRELSENWDNSGWQVVEPDIEVTGILVCLDPTMEVVNEAVELNCNLILSHHPLLFRQIKSVNTSTPEGAIVMALAQKQICLYSAHTNLDIAPGGINDYLAELLKLNNVEILKKTSEVRYHKISIFTPRGYEAQVRTAICNAGAGEYNDYSNCTFSARGMGTFMPSANATPFIGAINVLEEVEEIKIESIVPEDKIPDVLSALRLAHPYEEIAYDLIPLENNFAVRGIGRIGNISQSKESVDFVEYVMNLFNLKSVTVYGDYTKPIQKIALCSGSGGDLVDEAIKASADLYISGDIKYHQALDAQTGGMAVFDVGHYESEQIFMAKFAQIVLSLLTEQGIPVLVSKKPSLLKSVFVK